ncbi:hypothetical protein Hanom_Chr09g00787661 [Helianthus anomalus]
MRTNSITNRLKFLTITLTAVFHGDLELLTAVRFRNLGFLVGIVSVTALIELVSAAVTGEVSVGSKSEFLTAVGVCLRNGAPVGFAVTETVEDDIENVQKSDYNEGFG